MDKGSATDQGACPVFPAVMVTLKCVSPIHGFQVTSIDHADSFDASEVALIPV